MRSSIVSVDKDTTLVECAVQLVEQKVSSLLITNNGEYEGIVTPKDIVRKAIAKGLDPKTTLAHAVMSSPILGMEYYLPREEAHEYMLRHKIKHLAATDNKKIIGILTFKDMTR
ncbi:MAG: CBS domain-containing protein [Candidatus Nitrohelix vancouverensis]|uniref:CBS domain-containing protein n=1 Tax=Candidatus Nitrohelix vancouverensis TaxID=2705534 RepID=A0A7T0C4D7_9BACT|nr:MAG: CBS domain-containing protein [Candidatus Nitrohelix vancouverensis]